MNTGFEKQLIRYTTFTCGRGTNDCWCGIKGRTFRTLALLLWTESECAAPTLWSARPTESGLLPVLTNPLYLQDNRLFYRTLN